MCHLNDGTGCYGQRQGTIPIVGGTVRAIHLVVAHHSHLVLSIRVPVSMLFKRLVIVELVMPRLTSSLHLAFPSVCPDCGFLSVECGYIRNVEDSEVYPAAVDFSKIFGQKVSSLGQRFHYGHVILTVWLRFPFYCNFQS
jgi:hypothetical protein